MAKPYPELVSVFDIFKIGVGPSSSHTMGPWKAARQFLLDFEAFMPLETIQKLRIFLFGSLAKTGKGHGTDFAILLGLQGESPETTDTALIRARVAQIKAQQQLSLLYRHSIPFYYETDLRFVGQESLPFHPNGMRFEADYGGEMPFAQQYYSVGGGFIVKEGEPPQRRLSGQLPYPTQTPTDLQDWCLQTQKPISALVWENERYWRSEEDIRAGLLRIWHTMRACMYRGGHAEGELPGGLRVIRRAAQMNLRLLEGKSCASPEEWQATLQGLGPDFQKTLRWVSCFALAVNEENADFGRVVTAPTNGPRGVIPAVLMYYVCFHKSVSEEDICKFLLTAGEIGSLFKKGATISAAMGGCQAEIGVSSAMAAAALTERLGGSPLQALMAAEIAMEHHLGLTCDPIGGLVQIPCIERNSMGAIKAITAAQIALESDPAGPGSLDAVIQTMMRTARDMSDKYKETAEGGLAVQIPINVIEC
ncbi:MAG: L-serine ammonia-lyase [Microscillaceae bacterium]|nr:L-serine ammonia-lyase [Microscillaceae bacterium]